MQGSSAAVCEGKPRKAATQKLETKRATPPAPRVRLAPLSLSLGNGLGLAIGRTLSHARLAGEAALTRLAEGARNYFRLVRLKAVRTCLCYAVRSPLPTSVYCTLRPYRAQR